MSEKRNDQLKIGWFILWLSRGEACLAPTFQLINSEDAIDAGYNKMQVNPESCILNLSSPSDSQLSAFSNQCINPFLNQAFKI